MAGGFTNYGGTRTATSTESPWKFRMVYVAAFASLVLAFATGMVIGFPATALVNMETRGSPVHPTEDEKTWIASSLDLGALVGGYAAAPVSQRYGRLTTLIFTTIPFTAGWVCIMEAQNVIVIIVGRVLTGICCGISMAAVPSYVVEISSPEIRGFLGASFQLFIALGILIANIVGWYISWPWLALCSSAPPVVSLCIMCFMPESPRWLVAKGRSEKAIEGIKFLHGTFLDPAEEVVAIEDDLKAQDASEGMSLSEVKHPRFWKPAAFALLLMLYQQICGINIIIYYTVDIFNSAGGSMDGNEATIIVSAIQAFVTIISVFIMDRAGRRILLTISSIGMVISLGLLGTFFYLKDHAFEIATNPTFGYVPLISLVIYIAAFGIGYGPVAWIMQSELAPLKARSIICGLGTGFNWTMAFIVTKTFVNLKGAAGNAGVYWFYACTCATSLIFVWGFLPETRGKALEEILQFYTVKSTIIEHDHQEHQEQQKHPQEQEISSIHLAS